MHVVSDMTAGIDAVGTSMFCISDINVFVVEPTLKSISVLDDFKNVTSEYKTPIYVIANKIECDEDIEFIKNNIDEKLILGYVKSSDSLKEYEQGNKKALNEFENEIENIFEKLEIIVSEQKRNWNRYLQNNKNIFVGVAKSWYDSLHNQDYESLLEKDFSYENIIKRGMK